MAGSRISIGGSFPYSLLSTSQPVCLGKKEAVFSAWHDDSSVRPRFQHSRTSFNGWTELTFDVMDPRTRSHNKHAPLTLGPPDRSVSDIEHLQCCIIHSQSCGNLEEHRYYKKLRSGLLALLRTERSDATNGAFRASRTERNKDSQLDAL